MYHECYSRWEQNILLNLSLHCKTKWIFSVQGSTFHSHTRQDQTTLKIWATATRQMMTGRCLRPLAAVYNYAQRCGHLWLGRLLGARSSPARSITLPPLKPLLWITRSTTRSPGRKLYTAPQSPLTLQLSRSVRDWIHHTPKYTNTQIHCCDGSLINSCSWALLLLSLCDWCLASLALTNTDWSQTCDDFGPNLFKGSSLYVQLYLVSELNLESLQVVAENQRRGENAVRDKVVYLPASSTTGAGQSRKVSCIPAGLSSGQNQDTVSSFLTVNINVTQQYATIKCIPKWLKKVQS